jgi:hypothetical protein
MDVRCLLGRPHNFQLQRNRRIPQNSNRSLRPSAVSPLTESEIWEYGATVPERPGLRLYGEFFHLSARLSITRAKAVEGILFLNSQSLLPRSFGDAPVVQAEFTMNVPWVICEPPPS